MYKPRHRKQRDWKTPAGKGVAVGVATAGIATAALATAPGASAHPYTVWDRVAACESSGNWHINTGNGYYGGLQFTYSTWLAYHGGKYASRADHATRWQQIQVARRVLAGQGPYAWPVCGPRAGLTRASGGATSAPLPAARTAVAHHRARHHRVHRYRIVRIYHVRSGDTLAKIANRFNVNGGWRAVWRANRVTVGPNPNVIRVGQRLRIPA